KVLEELKEATSARSRAGIPPQSDIPRPVFSKTGEERSLKSSSLRFESMGIARDDEEARREWRIRGARFFDAPHCIIIYTDRSIGPYSIFDAGLVAQNLTLAALGYGLGTCLAVQAVYYPDLLRRLLGIAESKLIVLGTPIGYPDWDHPANKYRSPREPLDNLVTWHGL
ncbi:MAG: nitroreductase, partial [Chloroflexi bacterium]|nr:nitroreductase [Chloroflexota bacterium]